MVEMQTISSLILAGLRVVMSNQLWFKRILDGTLPSMLALHTCGNTVQHILIIFRTNFGVFQYLINFRSKRARPMYSRIIQSEGN